MRLVPFVLSLALVSAQVQADSTSHGTLDDGGADHGSVSCGSANRGALASGRAMPDQGDGFVVPEPWRSRGLQWGTDELVELIERAATVVARDQPGGTLGVADLSAEHGGRTRSHHSHQSGRDADLLYYALDADDRPFAPDSSMPYFERDGRARRARSPEAKRIDLRFFDLARNWAFVKALLSDGKTQVARIFVSRRIKGWLLAYARTIGEDEDLIRAADAALRRPEDSQSHNDHMHLRIGCPTADLAAGACDDHLSTRRHRAVTCPK